jgi:hypothetical protein
MVAVFLLLSTTACYTHRPLATPVPAPATRVVAEVTDSGTVAMSNAIGPGAVEVEGVVATASDEVWNLQLVRVDHRDGRSIPWNRETVAFPRHLLTNAMERQLDRKRSWFAAGAIVAGALIAARLFTLIGADDPTDENPLPQEILVPAGARRE